jgi:hypothetical protein
MYHDKLSAKQPGKPKKKGRALTARPFFMYRYPIASGDAVSDVLDLGFELLIRTTLGRTHAVTNQAEAEKHHEPRRRLGNGGRGADAKIGRIASVKIRADEIQT